MKSAIFAALLATASPMAFVLPALADGIGEVTLSSGGLAEIVRHVDLAAGSGDFTLEVPADQTDDILKSLIVSDPAGPVASVTLDGANAVDETFKRLPFTRDDLKSTAALLTAMTGFAVTVDDGAGHKDTGTILGVATVTIPGAGDAREDARQLPAVTLQRDDGSLAQVLLGPGAAAAFADPTVAARIKAATEVLRASADTSLRTIRVATAATTARTVGLSYVVAAPVWKAAYRVLPVDGGKYRVQGWAVLENGSGDDWSDVRLTLNSSNPVALRQRLSDMYWRDRREVPVLLPGGAIDPMVDDGGATNDAMEAEAMPSMAMPAPAMMRQRSVGKAMAPAAGLAGPARSREAASAENEVGVSFTLPEPVTLSAGGSLTVPIIDSDFDADLVSLWTDGMTDAHPQAAIYLANASGHSVPPGLLTVYDRSGYAGDAEMLGIPPGEKRFAVFAADTKTRVTSDSRETSTLKRVSAGDGVLDVTRARVRTTVYHVVAPKDDARTMLIDHDRLAGADVATTAEIVSEDPSSLRLRAKVAAGTSGDVSLTETVTVTSAVRVDDASGDDLVTYATSGAIDPAIAAKLKAIAAIKSRIAGLRRSVDDADAAIARAADDQERYRRILGALPATSDAAKGYIAKIEAREKIIDAKQTARDDAQARVDDAGKELAAAIDKL